MATVPIVGEDGRLSSPVETVRPIRDRIRRAREHRKRFEETWQVDLAFAAGQQWHVWDRNWRSLRRIQDVDPAYEGRELYQVDLIQEYRSTVLGELGSDDDRPQLLLAQEGQAQEEYQKMVNRGLEYAWEVEAKADLALSEIDRYLVDLGTCAIRCRFDPALGPMRDKQVPFYEGRPILDNDMAMEVMGSYGEGPIPGVELRDIQEGRICWEPLSPFNLLPPPGVAHERYFPWEAIIRAVPLEELKAEYGEGAAELQEDSNISSTLGNTQATSAQSASTFSQTDARGDALKEHAWLITYYERPSKMRLPGRVFHFGGEDLKLLRIDEQLPYKRADGTYCSGISYFHYWRVTGRFWSRSLVNAMKDPQRAYNKRRTQDNEIIDRGLPYVLAPRGTDVDRKGTPLEIVRYDDAARVPTPVQGIGPGTWMEESLNRIQSDMERSSGVRGPSLGENPTNVSTYSQLALLKEADAVKRQEVIKERKAAIAELVEFTVYDIRTYWGDEKRIILAGDEETISAEVFNATRIPDYFVVKTAKGAAQPRSQAAELQKVHDISDYAAQTGQPLPVRWLKDSYDSGQALDLPEEPAMEQVDKAELENHVLLAGQPVGVAYYDPPEVHVPIHRIAQIKADLSGDVQAVEIIEQHIQLHQQAAQQAMLMQMAAREGVGEPTPPAPLPAPQGGGIPQPAQGGTTNGTQA